MKEYLTDDDFKRAAELGVSERLLKQRFYYQKYDITKEEAITRPVGKRKRRRYTEELLALAKSNDIGYQTLASRVHHGMDEKEAATKPIRGKRKCL